MENLINFQTTISMLSFLVSKFWFRLVFQRQLVQGLNPIHPQHVYSIDNIYAA